MPLTKCGDNNGGWRWGDKGKCFTGPGAKRRAIKQGIVIEGPKKFSQEARLLESEHQECVSEAMSETGFTMSDIVAYNLECNLKRRK